MTACYNLLLPLYKLTMSHNLSNIRRDEGPVAGPLSVAVSETKGHASHDVMLCLAFYLCATCVICQRHNAD
jgi:hypothetical protein